MTATPLTLAVELDPPGPRAGSDYSRLLRRIRAAGLLDPRPVRDTARVAIVAALFLGGWTAFALVGDSWWVLLVAGWLAVAFTQVGFVGHEIGHRQVFRSRRANDLAGLIHGNLAIGLSYGWWVDKHSRHHAHPNQEEHDPDIGDGALAFTAGHARIRRGAGRWLARHQAVLFFPLLLLEALNLHVGSGRALARPGLRHRGWEIALLAVHIVGYLAVVFLVLSPGKAFAFIALQQGLFGLYLGCSFAPNHKGMPILAADDHSDYLRRQVLTARNVRGGRTLDFALGGLNYQIEHHLFPSMPRGNLRRAQAMVESFCHQHGVAYHQTTLVDSYAQALIYLHRVGRTPLAPAG